MAQQKNEIAYIVAFAIVIVILFCIMKNNSSEGYISSQNPAYPSVLNPEPVAFTDIPTDQLQVNANVQDTKLLQALGKKGDYSEMIVQNMLKDVQENHSRNASLLEYQSRGPNSYTEILDHTGDAQSWVAGAKQSVMGKGNQGALGIAQPMDLQPYYYMVPSSLNYYYEDGGTGNNGMEAALKEGRIDQIRDETIYPDITQRNSQDLDKIIGMKTYFRDRDFNFINGQLNDEYSIGMSSHA